MSGPAVKSKAAAGWCDACHTLNAHDPNCPRASGLARKAANAAKRRAAQAEAKCRHCRVGKVLRPKGLCWSCYYTPGVKDRYESTSKYARRGSGTPGGNVTPPPPLVPTHHRPGTPGKIAVMAARAARGEQVFHPADAGLGGLPGPAAARGPAWLLAVDDEDAPPARAGPGGDQPEDDP